MAVDVGSAYVSILPDLSRLPGMIRSGVTIAAQQAGTTIETEITQAAEQAGQAIQTEVSTGAHRAEGSIAGLAGSIAAVAAVAAGIGEALTQSLNQHRMEAALGISPQDAKQAAEVAAQVYGQAWGDSLDQVSTSIQAIYREIGTIDSGVDLEGLTKKALAFGDAFGQETPDLIKAVGQMLKTGLAVDANEAFDILAVGFQNGTNKADDLLDTFNEYGTQFRKLGLDGQTALGLISQAVQSGARDSDLAADALKEFSIRAVDGSKTSAEAYKAIGLNASKMTTQIAKGGEGASAGLALVLDRLRAMKDPVEREAAAIGLFGTQAEDLGLALYALDPAAVDGVLGLESLAGAGDRVTGSIEAAHDPLEVFKREGMAALADATAAAVPWLQRGLDVLRPWIPELVTATLAIAGLVTVVKTVSIINTAVTAIKAWQIGAKAAAIATKVWTGVQWLWNAAMSANPIGLIVIGVLALVAAIVIAYKRSETFRNIVQGAWEGIQTAATWAWEKALKPAFDGIMVAVRWVGDAAVWLWQNAIQPAWSGISAVVTWAWTKVIQPYLAAVRWWFTSVIAPAAMFLWGIIKTVWSGISLAIDIAWTLIKVVFNLIRIYVQQVVAPVFLWLWRNVALPVWTGIRTSIDVAWAAIKLVWDAIKWYLEKVVAPVFRWIWNSVIQPVWNAIRWGIDNVVVPGFNWLRSRISAVWADVRTVLSVGWNWIRDKVFNPVRDFVTKTIPDAFRTGTDAIGRAWSAVQDLAKKPVTFVVNSVINPLIRGYNKIVDRFGGEKVGEIQGFHVGGSVWGPGTATSDSIPAMLSRGEHVWTAAEVHGAGGHDAVLRMRALAKAGQIPSFAGGGIVEWIKDPIGAAKSALGGSLAKLDEIAGTPFGQMIAGMPRRLFDLAVDKAKGLFGSWFGGAGGGSIGGAWPSSPGAQRGDSGVWRSIVALIRSTGPISGAFGNAFRPGDPLWHGSGRAVDWMGYNQDALASFLAARKPLELIHRTATADYAWTRGRNMGSFSESLMNAHRNHIHVAYDSGGWLQPGWTPTYNGTRRPEAVLTDRQWRDIRAVAVDKNRDDRPNVTYVVQPQRADFKIADLEALQRRQEALARVGRPS
ncbi:phage tail tape measure protein [Polymorphospora rubra]|uniref:phage tail tape measure protein n=1 Tax=Polymorphospora rubra TaxID=338584 RepID=UPI0033EE5FBB